MNEDNSKYLEGELHIEPNSKFQVCQSVWDNTEKYDGLGHFFKNRLKCIYKWFGKYFKRSRRFENTFHILSLPIAVLEKLRTYPFIGNSRILVEFKHKMNLLKQ